MLNNCRQFQKSWRYARSASFVLDSTGGDVSAAISIGRLVRKYELTTFISENAKCYSSCALIFIAGVQRGSFGELGLHRPYFSSAPQSRETLEKQVPLMISMIKSYIAEMGVTDNFYQQMVNTEPSQMVIYDHNDYTALVPYDDPVFSEIEMARRARMFGVSTAEMRQRTLDAHSCPSLFAGFQEWSDCTDAIDWGLSKRTYLERYAKAKKECWFSDEEEFSAQERATIANTPTKLRPDLPLQIRWETCVRNIMQGRDASRQTGWLKSLFGQ
jgi:hypothetical protein